MAGRILMRLLGINFVSDLCKAKQGILVQGPI